MAILVQSNKKPSVSYPEQTGSIVTFNSQYAGLPLKSHKIALTATQSGSGTPSPDNVRTINGYNDIGVYATGKNLFSYDLTIRDGYWTYESFVGSNAIVPKENADTWQYIRIYVEGLSSVTLSGFDNQGGTLCAWLSSENVNDVISRFNSANKNGTKTVPNGAKYLCLTNYSIKDKITTYPNAQLEIGDTATAIEPFGTYTTINLGGTYYGGEYDARTGVFTVTHGYIASYNGETINEPWISSMDEYVEGGTPSIGAQVVYLLATPQTIQLPPCPIETLQGINNIWADTGDTTVQYIKIGG